MYLSKIRLDEQLPLEKLGGEIPKDAYGDHQVVWRIMGSGPDRPRDFLFRREQMGYWPVYYVLSEQPPTNRPGWQVDTKDFRPRLTKGQRLAFALRANPVRTRRASSNPDDRKRYRDDIIMHAKRQIHEREPDPKRWPSQVELVQEYGPKWLEDRASNCGFTLETLHVDQYAQHRLYKGRGRPPIRFSTLDYQGILQISDDARFLEALHRGIGHAKGFGCGLMLVRRAV